MPSSDFLPVETRNGSARKTVEMVETENEKETFAAATKTVESARMDCKSCPSEPARSHGNVTT
eukprot:8107002-Karenia_brevis.AAC.1